MKKLIVMLLVLVCMTGFSQINPLNNDSTDTDPPMVELTFDCLGVGEGC